VVRKDTIPSLENFPRTAAGKPDPHGAQKTGRATSILALPYRALPICAT